MSIPSSILFHDLAWDEEMADCPTLNGSWQLPDGRKVEVALIGFEDAPETWPELLRHMEAIAERWLSAEAQVLAAASASIAAEHQACFPDRWTGSSEALLRELTLELLCIYEDDSIHLWYKGSAVFGHLNIDIGLDAELLVEEVRFDG